MYSSSSSSTDPQYLHDVFINFRGEDTRRTFVSHLYAVLSNAGINTFLDDEKLKKDEEIGPELLQAISVSRISIVVFSKNYAESSWCLNELDKIMECHRIQGQVVLPVFYDIDPSVVRHQKGEFGKALEVSAKRRYIKKEVLDRWKQVLFEASCVSGFNGNTFRSDRELVKKIVDYILLIVGSPTLPKTEFTVGLESHVKQVVGLIKKQTDNVCMAGIWGMGGSGKTTVAKAVYNKIHHRFDCSSFIENIREVCEQDTRGHMHLQQQLLSNVLKSKEKIHSIAFGTTTIQKVLSRRKTLVVLDDVTDFQQIKVLCGNYECFGFGSVLIVTTRDVHILKLLKVVSIYKMEEMNKNECLELFSWHAFRKATPKGDFSELSRKVAGYCGGLPQALEVLGSYLYGRTREEWTSVLSKLERIPNDLVHQKLRISYDGLKDDMVKDIFLDICCFFIGKDRAYVTEILNGCGLYADSGIAVLIERSLLKVKKNNKLGMNDLIRDMGREIVRESSAREPGKRSRLWFHEDVLDVLTKNTGTETVEALILSMQRTGRVSFSTNVFQDMKKLRFLQLDRVDLTGDYKNLSKELRWLHWKGFTLNYIPDNFYQGNLVIIDLKYSNITQVWNKTKVLVNLKILNLSHSRYLISSPDFSKLPNLEKLIMKDCPRLSKIHPSIGDLKNILLINLKDCTGLNNLPKKIYQLKSLKTLILSGCLKIDKLEEDIEQMGSLTTLIAKDTSVKEVPYSILRLKSIGYISICGYEGLSRDVFPSLLRSRMTPTTNSLPYISPFESMVLSLVSLAFESDNFDYLSPNPSSLSKIGKFWVQYRLEVQVTGELRIFLDDLSHESQSLNFSLRSLLMGLRNCNIVINTLGKSISQTMSGESSNIHNKYRLEEISEIHDDNRIDSQTIRVDSDDEHESLPAFKRSRKMTKSDHSSDGESASSVSPIILKEKSNSLRKEIKNPQQTLSSVKSKAPDAIKVPFDFINSLPQENILEKVASTPIISLYSPRVKQQKVIESITSKSSTSKGPSATGNVEKVSSKQESVYEHSPVDYSKYKELIEEDPLAMMEKLLSGELSFSSKTSQSTKQAEATHVEREAINTLLDDLRHVVFSSNLLKYLPNDTSRRDKVNDLLFKLDDRVDELSEKQVLGLAEFTKIFKEATIIIDSSRDNADLVQELEVNHKNRLSKLQASKDKMKRFAESIAAGQNKIRDIDHQIEDTQTQIQLLEEQVNKLHQEKSLLKDTCSKCHGKRVDIMKEVKNISSEAVEILEKTSHLEKKEQEFNLNYKRLQEHYTKMKLAPPF